MNLSRRTLLGAALVPFAAHAQGAGPVVGVSGPLTGQYAQYGADWQRGFGLALDEAAGNGPAIGLDFEDSQSDPRQAVAIAQKFVADPRIVIELGDFSSAASMAASPIYQRGKLVQFGFTNSHPDFTKTGDYMWSDAPNQLEEMPMLADFAVGKLGLKRPAVLFINGDWGRTSKDLFIAAAKKLGADVVGSEGYLPDEKDFRSTLVRLRDANPDGLILISYYPDGALAAQQIRTLGLKQPVVAASSCYSPKFLELGGDAVEGIYTTTNFFAADPRPVVQDFVSKYKAKYGTEPGSYAARAYDAMNVAIALIRENGADRQKIHDGLAKITVPSVIFGTLQFDPATRRVRFPVTIELQVRNGAFALWDGKAAG
jgi:branched-chain amino acid transport system substrate-binding protein